MGISRRSERENEKDRRLDWGALGTHRIKKAGPPEGGTPYLRALIKEIARRRANGTLLEKDEYEFDKEAS